MTVHLELENPAAVCGAIGRFVEKPMQGEVAMIGDLKHVRHGFGAVRPYVYGRLELWDLVRDAFGAVEIERHQVGPTAFHIEARIGDSTVVLEAADPPHSVGTPASIYVYVADVDDVYRRALDRGVSSISAPEDKPYQERMAGVRDSFGNVWWISTYRG